MPENILEDGSLDFSLGQDAWTTAERIRENQYARGINVSNRGGILTPRNGFHQRALLFDDTVTIPTKYGYSRTLKSIWEGGKFQALIPVNSGYDRYLITIISGYIFLTNTRSFRTVVLSTTIKVNQYAPRINWTFAADKVVIFDYPDYPIVVDGLTIFRCSPTHTVNNAPAPQVPIAVLGAYNQNRLFIANNGVEFTAGDGVGNLATPEAPITFTEVFTPSSPFYNQFFALGNGESQHSITAMGFIQALDQSLGIGSMFVATNQKVYYYNTQQPRDQWTTSQFGGLLIANAGVVGPRAFTNINSDVIFLSTEGQVHAFSASREESRRWGNVPLSREVDYFLHNSGGRKTRGFREPGLYRYAAIGYFDNRVFITANPYRVQATTSDQQSVPDYAHGGFVVLELDVASSLLSETPPVWPGLWTGINPMDIQVVGEKCYIMSKDGIGAYGSNALYELSLDTTFDMVRGRKRMVRSQIHTKNFDFENGFVQKREHTITLKLSDIAGKFYVRIDRKPSHASTFTLYGEWNHEAPTCVEEMPLDSFINGLADHNFKGLVFGDALTNECIPVTNEMYDTFEAVQLRITLEGEYWSLDSVKLQAILVPLRERQQEFLCAAEGGVKLPSECSQDWIIPEEICQ